MPTLIDLRQRIRSVRNSQKITQAMKTVSMAKFRKAQRTVLESRPYWHLFPDLVGRIAAHSDADLVCEVRLTGQRPDALRVEEAELTRRMGGSFLQFRFRDLSVPPLAPEPLPPRDTVAGAFLHDLRDRITAAEAEGKYAEAVELREMLRVGRTVITGGPIAVPQV